MADRVGCVATRLFHALLAAVLLAGAAAAEEGYVPLMVLKGQATEATAAGFFPDGATIIGGSDQPELRLWDSETGRQSAVWRQDLSAGVSAVAVSSDGASVATGGDDGHVRLLDARSGRVLFAWSHGKPVNAVAFAAGGRLVLSAGDDTLIRVWDRGSGQQSQPWRGHESGVRALTVAADGRRAFSGDKDGAVRLWDVAAGRSLTAWSGHRGAVLSVALSPTGLRGLSGGADGTVRFWDIAAGTATVWRGGSMVPAVALSPDGRLALWGDDDGQLHLGDAASGREVTYWPGLGSSVLALGFSPDGRTAVSATWDGALRVWEIPPRRRAPLEPPAAATAEAVKEALARINGHAVPGHERPPRVPRLEALGRALFFDRRLSRDGTVSCASCHRPDRGFSDGLPRAEGIAHRTGPRNTPSLLNVSEDHYRRFMWDGRHESLEEAALSAIQNPLEMDQKLERLKEAAGVEPQQAAAALEAFIRSVARSGDSAFDRFRLGEGELSPEAIDGLLVFAGKGRCLHCHPSPDFTDATFRNIGLAPAGPEDLGRFPFDPRPENRGAFRTPSLRNVALTGPYMHDGRFTTLRDVVDFFDRGGDLPAEEMVPLHLTKGEKKSLIVFLESLTSADLAPRAHEGKALRDSGPARH